MDKIEELDNHLKDCVVEICLLQEEDVNGYRTNQEEDVNGYRTNQEIESYSRSVSEKEFDEANKKLPKGKKPLDIKELIRIADEIYFHPSRNTQIIRSMRQRFANSPS